MRNSVHRPTCYHGDDDDADDAAEVNNNTLLQTLTYPVNANIL